MGAADNKLVADTTDGNGRAGIDLAGGANKIHGTTALGNTVFDLRSCAQGRAGGRVLPGRQARASLAQSCAQGYEQRSCCEREIGAHEPMLGRDGIHRNRGSPAAP